MVKKNTLLFALTLCLCVSSLSTASAPDPLMSTATSAAGHVLLCPSDDTPTLASLGLSIDVTLRDAGGVPCVGIAETQIWLPQFSADCSGGCCGVPHNPGNPHHSAVGDSCSRTPNPDSPTNGSGLTTFSNPDLTEPRYGPNYSQAGIDVAFRGQCPDWQQVITGSPPLPITFNSVDMTSQDNGPPDGKVDIYDSALLASLLFTSDFRADFNVDGIVNLADVIIFLDHMDHGVDGGGGYSCPGQLCQPTVPCDGNSTVGVWFDAAGTVLTSDVTPGVPFTFYVVLKGAGPTDNMLAYEYALSVDAPLFVFGETLNPGVWSNVGTPITSGGGMSGTVRAVFEFCTLTTDPFLLGTYQAVLQSPADNVNITVGPVIGGDALPNPHCPPCDCVTPCPFQVPTQDNCRVNCDLVPVPVVPATWGTVKGHFID